MKLELRISKSFAFGQNSQRIKTFFFDQIFVVKISTRRVWVATNFEAKANSRYFQYKKLHFLENYITL